MIDPEPAFDSVRPDRHSAGDRFDASLGNAALVILAVLAMGAAATVLGPVLKPFLVALFLFYATQFGAKSFARLGMQPWTAYLVLISLALICAILTAQLVYREAEVFQRTWPRYEDRISSSLAMWMPQLAAPLSPDSPSQTGDRSRPTVSSPSQDSPRQAAADALPSTAAEETAAGDTTKTAAEAQVALEPRHEKLPEQTADLFGKPATAETSSDSGAEAGSESNSGATSESGSEARSESGSEGSDDAVLPRRSGGDIRGRTSLTDVFRITSQDVLKYVFSHSLDVAELIVVVFCYLVFLFLGSRKLKARVLRAFPGERSTRLVAIGDGITESMERFMVVKTLAGVGMAVSAAIIMHGFGLDHWMLWAFLFFALNYITYIGSAVACVPPLIMAYLDLDSHVMALVLSTLVVLNRVFWIDFFELRMSGKQLNLDPTLLFLWLSYWGWAWGILGLILAYPMLAALRIALEHIGGLSGWAVLLSDE
jgi:predicted PurR-regulated permease PerM